MKKMMMICLTFVILTACSKQQNILKLATGNTGGAYYPIGSAIAEMLTDKSQLFSVNSYTGNASVSNIEKIHTHQVDMAIVQSNIAHWAINGFGMFKDQRTENIRGIASLYPEMIQIIVRKDSGILSVEDLIHKKVSIGIEGSGNYFDAVKILEAHGVFLDDIEVYNYTFSESVLEMTNNSIDAIFITSGIPTSSVITIASEFEISVLEIKQSILEELIKKESYYTVDVIPKDMYHGMEKDIMTLSTKAILVCDASLDDEIVYDITKIFWESIDVISDANNIAKSIMIEHALEGLGIPLHPGALKYYKEQGIDTKE